MGRLQTQKAEHWHSQHLSAMNGRTASTPIENAPDLTSRGRSHFLEHETGLELLGSFASSPPRWQGDVRLDFIEFFAQTDQIGSFRSIVGDAKGARNLLVRPPAGEAEHQLRAHPALGFEEESQLEDDQ
jgi:hypothetical protein